MPPISSLLFTYVFLSFVLCELVSAGHIHRHRKPRHHHERQVETPIFKTFSPIATVASAEPSVTAGNAVVSDIEEIQKGLADLPGDLLSFVEDMEQRIEALESILAGFLSKSSPTTPWSGTPFTTMRPPRPFYQPPGHPPMHATHAKTNTSQHVFTTGVSYGSGNRTAYPSHTTAPASSSHASAVAVTVTIQYASPSSTGATIGEATSTFVTYSLSPSPTPYTFQPNASDNVAVYYGSSPDTQAGGLLALCESSDVDIVILAFVDDFFTQQGYPTISFGPGCTTPTTAQMNQAPGLMDCSALAPEIVGCQEIGKPVLVSLGGYIANSSFASDDQATQFANTLWNLFGAVTSNDSDLRPFGANIVIDGFDVDNENHNTAYYQTFATALRQQFNSDQSKPYYLSTAPQCPMPDESIPLGAMTQADFVWVQFYNNPQCNLDSPDFQASFEAWSANLSASSITPGKPLLYIGVAAFSAAGSGYVEGSALSAQISLAQELGVSNLGGIMLWDGSEGMANVDQYGENYLEYAKTALLY